MAATRKAPEPEPEPESPDELAIEIWEDEAPSSLRDSQAAVDASGQAPPRLRDVPIEAGPPGWRVESDTLGPVAVPADRYWGPQTQRALEYFAIGRQRMPIEVYRAYGHVKKSAAMANVEAGVLAKWKAAAIVRACDEIAAGLLDDHFPLLLFQSGSGTQTNANVNEVIANRGNQLLGAPVGSTAPLHPNDDVNMSQSSNDTFVTAMHVAAYRATIDHVLPALRALARSLADHATEWADVAKVGRTHLMDATTLTVGQEWSGYAAAVEQAVADVEHASAGLLEVALGGTAVGTGVNTPPGFTVAACRFLADAARLPVRPAANAFAAQSTLDAMVRAHAGLKSASVTLFKIANDLRWLASGPRAGLGELRLPANEPGSTIMPGKVNPSQAEALLMACVQVLGNDTTVSIAGAEGNFELNAFRPIVIHGYLQSAHVLADATRSFTTFLVDGASLVEERLSENVSRSVMVVTRLAPAIGYERAAAVVRRAIDLDISARDAALQAGIDPEVFDAATAGLHP
ncbi:MAG: class II fumarate hydratase [Candidatus Nanopelagicales bacterium]